MRHLLGSQRRCVLIVDDDPVFTLLAGETLQQAGFRAPVAHTLRTALALFNSERPDLVLLDVELPDASGFDMCAQIHAAPAGIDVPIIMVTGNNDTEPLEFLRTHRCDQAQGYLISKPISSAELEQLLRSGSNARHVVRSSGAQRAGDVACGS